MKRKWLLDEVLRCNACVLLSLASDRLDQFDLGLKWQEGKRDHQRRNNDTGDGLQDRLQREKERTELPISLKVQKRSLAPTVMERPRGVSPMNFIVGNSKWVCTTLREGSLFIICVVHEQERQVEHHIRPQKQARHIRTSRQMYAPTECPARTNCACGCCSRICSNAAILCAIWVFRLLSRPS